MKKETKRTRGKKGEERAKEETEHDGGTSCGAGYFDEVTTVIQGGSSSVTALKGSTEEKQFK